MFWKYTIEREWENDKLVLAREKPGWLVISLQSILLLFSLFMVPNSTILVYLTLRVCITQKSPVISHISLIHMTVHPVCVHSGQSKICRSIRFDIYFHNVHVQTQAYVSLHTEIKLTFILNLTICNNITIIVTTKSIRYSKSTRTGG